MSLSQITELIRRRRSIYPKSYLSDRPVDRQTIELLLENANWAPTHKRTEPWRFRVFHSAESREALGDVLSAHYRANTPDEQFSEEKFRAAGLNPRLAGAVIALVVQYHPEANLPAFEEEASLAMAVENMWLTCTALDLGCYWATPGALLKGPAILNLGENERCLGLFYLGWHEMPEIPGKRNPVSEKTTWL